MLQGLINTVKATNMKVTIETEDLIEAKRLLKSTDLALCLWEIMHNLPRKFENDDVDYQFIFDAIWRIVERHGIDLNDIIE